MALVDHGSEINLMSMDFYKKGKWPINTKHGWKIRAATRPTEELHGAYPNVLVKIGDVEIDQHFFVQETSSHPVILEEPTSRRHKWKRRCWTMARRVHGSRARMGVTRSSS